MKIQGFNNRIPPAGENRNALKSQQVSDSVNNAGKDTASKLNSTAKISNTPNNPARLISGKDRIELSPLNSSRDSIDNGRAIDDVTYGPDIATGASGAIRGQSSESRISSIRQNIAEGYYDSPEFIEKLADLLIEEFYLAGEKD